LTLTSGAILNLSPGLYNFTDSISLGGGSTLIGSQVTVLLASGTTGSPKTLSVAGSAIFVLTPATPSGATDGQIPGIVFASQSVGTSTLYTGNSTNPFIGVIYYPNGLVAYAGDSYTGSPGCGEVIAKTITVTGNATFDASSCASYGATAFSNQTSIVTARVVK